VGGQEIYSDSGFKIIKKIKAKKFQKRQFLGFVFKLKNIPIFFKKTIKKLQNKLKI